MVKGTGVFPQRPQLFFAVSPCTCLFHGGRGTRTPIRNPDPLWGVGAPLSSSSGSPWWVLGIATPSRSDARPLCEGKTSRTSTFNPWGTHPTPPLALTVNQTHRSPSDRGREGPRQTARWLRSDGGVCVAQRWLWPPLGWAPAPWLPARGEPAHGNSSCRPRPARPGGRLLPSLAQGCVCCSFPPWARGRPHARTSPDCTLSRPPGEHGLSPRCYVPDAESRPPDQGGLGRARCRRPSRTPRAPAVC